jgi:hypothetical protein
LGVSENNNTKKVMYLRHKKLDKVLRVRFENEQRQHRGKLAKLVNNYMVDNFNKVNVRKFVFGMVHLFKSKNLLGKKNGFLSKKTFVLMLLSWMINRDLLVNAQEKQSNSDHREKKPSDWRERKFNKLTEETK